MRQKIIIISILLLTAINFFYNAVYKPLKKNVFYDYRALYAAGIEARSVNPQLYKSIIYRKTGFGYLPVISLLFIPQTYLTEETAVKLWFAINIIFLIAMIFLILKINRLLFYRDYKLITFVAVLNFNPVFETIKWGQVNIIVYCLMLGSLYFYLLNRKLFTSILLGTAIIFKVIPGLLILYFLIRKEFKIVFLTFVTMLFFLGISISIFGINLHKDYFTVKLPGASKFGYKGDIYDQSFQGMSFRLFWGDNGYTNSWIDNFNFSKRVSSFLRIGALLTLIIFLFNRKKNNDNKIKSLEFALTIVTIHLFHSLSWEHHFVWSLYLYILLFIILREFNFEKKIFYAVIISFIVVAAKYGYDNKFFCSGIMILFTGIKLYGIIILWAAGLLTLKKLRVIS